LKGASIVDVCSGMYHTLVLTSDNRLISWGNNQQGSLGDGTTISDKAGVEVKLDAMSGEHITKIACGLYQNLVLTEKNNLYCWGNTKSAGDGTSIARTAPVMVKMDGALKDKVITQIASAYSHNLVLTEDNKLFAFGDNAKGQLGIGNTTQVNEPVEVNLSSLNNQKIVKISAAGRYAVTVEFFGSLVLTDNNKLYSWGSYDMAGDGVGNTRYQPGEVLMTGELNGKVITDIGVGSYGMFVSTDDNKLYAWNRLDFYGGVNSLSPTQMKVALDSDSIKFQMISGMETMRVVLAVEEIKHTCFSYSSSNSQVCSSMYRNYVISFY
jgi:DUF971 family protein